MGYDYAEAEWNRNLDDSIRQLELAIHVAQTIIGELNAHVSKCYSLRSLSSQYDDNHREDLAAISTAFRDAVGYKTAQVIRALKIASADAIEVERVLNGMG